MAAMQEFFMAIGKNPGNCIGLSRIIDDTSFGSAVLVGEMVGYELPSQHRHRARQFGTVLLCLRVSSVYDRKQTKLRKGGYLFKREIIRF